MIKSAPTTGSHRRLQKLHRKSKLRCRFKGARLDAEMARTREKLTMLMEIKSEAELED